MVTEKDIAYLKQAMNLALEGVEEKAGGPFGCIIVKDGQVVGKG